ncbi:MAG: aminotransferase class V-fold PLP-dependent enzyme [Spirochaetaceae bacterium]|jgi:cysteine desulfurase|nr:aminotransferase class V-fold PLP-dependent enzyme [Spirochaetaceae bacterium]
MNETRKIYMDYNATTPISAEVKAQMIEDLNIYGNASSMHADGRHARNRIEEARQQVAALIGGKAPEIVFTSGGSEANNMVFHTAESIIDGTLELSPQWADKLKGRNEIITSAIEHPCVLNSAKYLATLSKKGTLNCKVIFVPVDADGKLDMDAYKAALSDKTLLVSVMMANNEIGTIQDVKAIAALAHEAGALFHSDIVQACGKIPISVGDMRIDYATMSCHKIYGPKGIGVLYAGSGFPLYPLIQGGHQEDGMRAGTYNNLGILGYGKAAELAKANLADYGKTMRALRNRLRDGLLKNIPNIKINGHPEDVLPNTLNVSFPGAEGEAILLSMDLAGIEASTGSACASGSLEPSHVLMAIGANPELAHGSIRFSVGLGVTEEDIDYVIETMPPIIKRLRAMSTID